MISFEQFLSVVKTKYMEKMAELNQSEIEYCKKRNIEITEFNKSGRFNVKDAYSDIIYDLPEKELLVPALNSLEFPILLSINKAVDFYSKYCMDNLKISKKILKEFVKTLVPEKFKSISFTCQQFMTGEIISSKPISYGLYKIELLLICFYEKFYQ